MIFLWPRKTVLVSVRYLFYQRSKHGLFVFPNLCGEGTVRLANRISVWRQSEVSIDFRKVLGYEVFSPEHLLNQPKATSVCILSTNQSNRSISFRLLFLFCSRVFISRSYENRSQKTVNVYVNTLRQQMSTLLYSRCYSFKGATSRYLLSFWER